MQVRRYGPHLGQPPTAVSRATDGGPMEQRIAVIVSAIVGTLILALFATVARSAGTAGNADEIAAASARWRRATFWGLVLLFIPAIGYSLTKTPYRSGTAPAAVIVQ